MIKVNPPTTEEAVLLESRAIMSLFWPAQNKELLEQMSKQGATVLAMDCLPRTLSRGQVLKINGRDGGVKGEAGKLYSTVYAFQIGVGFRRRFAKFRRMHYHGGA